MSAGVNESASAQPLDPDAPLPGMLGDYERPGHARRCRCGDCCESWRPFTCEELGIRRIGER